VTSLVQLVHQLSNNIPYTMISVRFSGPCNLYLVPGMRYMAPVILANR
jgi:hypothetical protein